MRLWQECNNPEPKKCENINLESKSSSAQRVDYDDEEVENNEQNSPWELSTACLLWLSGSPRWLNSSIAPHLLDDEDVDDGDDDGEDADCQDDNDESSPKSGESFCYMTAKHSFPPDMYRLVRFPNTSSSWPDIVLQSNNKMTLQI